jgi:hypothetical protein
MACIRVLTEGGEEQFPLSASVTTLGRGLESDVRLKDIKASRRHCQIVRIPEGFQVLDLSSGNGTYVNGVQVKQQRLLPGDKIQVGSTTITFDDTPSSASEKKSPPAAPASAPRLESVPAVPPASAAPPPAPARKSSVSSSAALPAAPRSGVESTAKAPAVAAPTRRLAAVRSGGSTRSSSSGGLEAGVRGGRKSSPALLIVAAIGVIFAGVVGAILFSGSGDSGEQLSAAVKKLGEEARTAEKAGRFDEADLKYRTILSKIEGKDRFRGDVVRINDARKENGERRALLADAPHRFGEIRSRATTVKEEETAALAREARQLLTDAGEIPFEWIRELREIAERLDRTSEAAGGPHHIDFQSRRSEIVVRCGLASESPRYGEAIVEWQSYSSGKNVSEENRTKAGAEIAAINRRAKDDLERMKARSVSLEKENRKAEALEELKKQRPRFKSTTLADELEGVISELEK